MKKSRQISFKQLLIEFLRLVFYTLKLFLKRFFKPKYLILLVFFYIIIMNWRSLSGFFLAFGIPEFTLIKDYFSVLLSLPVAFMVVTSVSFKLFKKEIKVFLKNSKLKQFGNLSFGGKGQSQTKKEISVSSENLPISDPDSSPSPSPSPSPAAEGDEVVVVPAETTEFYILNTASLVFNSKLALLWFYGQPEHTSTKQLFVETFMLSGYFENPNMERENIFSVLFANLLLEPSGGGLYRVSSKGTRFLKYIKLIPD